MHDPTTDATNATNDLALDGPRGPRRSFTIGGLHWIAWVFILFALGDLAWFIVSANFGASPSPADFAVYALQVLPAVAALLFPAALLARHPDATTRAPLLLLGTILFALVQGLFILAGPLQPIFEVITPASEELPNLVPLAALYNGLTLLIAACGLGFIARGLSLARRYEDRSGTFIELFVPVAAVLATVVGILSVSRLSLGDAPIPAIYIVYLGANIILGILRVAVWAYLTTSAVRGWRAGEDSIVGWRLAALAGGVVVLALALVNLAGVLDIQETATIDAYGWVVVIAYALGHLSLLAAFTLGLPSLDGFDDEDDEDDEDNEDGFEDEEAGYEGGPVYEDEFEDETIR